jgi:glycosyltransferase involved in cell wall biosynthesis
MAKTVLIVASCYPPVSAMGSVRIASFVRHLPTHGWKPLLVAAGPGFRTGDSGERTSEDRRICRTRAIDIGALVARVLGPIVRRHAVTRSAAASARRHSVVPWALRLYDEVLAFPDPLWPWYHLAKSRALAFAKAHRPDVLLSSSPHPTSHRLASYLQRSLEIPWVAEFRDFGSQTPWFQCSPVLNRRTQRFELDVIRRASALCAASPAVADTIAALHLKPTFVVLNGFEPEEYAVQPEPFQVFTIVYTGMIYPGKRDPRPVFEALGRLADRGVIRPGSIRLIFCGPNHEVTERLASDLGVRPYVECHGQLPRAEALVLQQRATLLLQLEWLNPAATGVYTGKFFEYLGAGRPILAVGPAGSVVEDTLRATGRGRMLSTVADIERFLERAIRFGPTVDLPSERRAAGLQQYTRAHQAGILAKHLDDLLRPSPELIEASLAP